ncbi:putative nucleotidyltransferase, ribonuclease H [Tanacetum coccineum]
MKNIGRVIDAPLHESCVKDCDLCKVRQPEFVYSSSSPLKSVKTHLLYAVARTLIFLIGCQGFLASVMDTSLESPNIENLPVVREFADVFPDELPGLPPAREIEFGIELTPGAEPISKAPYRESGYKQVAFLGHILSQDGIIMDPSNLKLSPNAETYYETEIGASVSKLSRTSREKVNGVGMNILCLVSLPYKNIGILASRAAPFELCNGENSPITYLLLIEKVSSGARVYSERFSAFVLPFRGVKRFGIKGKLSPRFIGPFEILERIGEVSYRLALPPQLSHVHDVFHVSLLRGYHYHPLHVASYPFDQIQPDMSLSEEPESILDRQERVMRNKVIPFVKILWKNHPEREATWETEESMRASYPHFFV